ncbi:efflux RND transporter periplasmic adaptor subunit [Oricola thermophila]|uniref:Efflux RND transporter periplasmic adaptor subunit n=1 Tax=Oricola thermophila TaxID=2742145 RepID=A0A6N1V940_9HYPH|nr:efflux RND transporter periplasmic adaptor subunit [Oricola thermophila]QKV17238.1 efflux RND transporter periplasmic adaptor subunit [Oricola thermophila]
MIKRFIIAFILLAVVVGGLVGFNLFRDQAIADFFANMQRPAVAVSTAEVEAVTWQPTVRAIGTVNAARGVDLTMEVTGVVKEILFKANDTVEEGQVLVRLDDEVQRADLAAAQSQLDLNRQALTRALELQERGVGSQSALDTAQAAATASASQVEKLQAVLNQKQLRAPFGGTIGIPQIDLGQYISPGQIVATLQDLGSMHVNFTVPEQQFGVLAIGQPVRVGLSEDDMPFRGEITGIDPKIDPSTRLVSVRAEIENPQGKLNPGQFVRVRVELPSEDDVIIVPQTALVTSLYGDYVYRVKQAETEDGELTVEQVFVKPGRRSNGDVEIVSGLAAGDVVVNAGQNRLSNGARVTINNEVQPTAAGANAQ